MSQNDTCRGGFWKITLAAIAREMATYFFKLGNENDVMSSMMISSCSGS